MRTNAHGLIKSVEEIKKRQDEIAAQDEGKEGEEEEGRGMKRRREEGEEEESGGGRGRGGRGRGNPLFKKQRVEKKEKEVKSGKELILKKLEDERKRKARMSKSFSHKFPGARR